MRALVTGANGFVGQYLARELLNARWRVSGFGVGPANMPRGVPFPDVQPTPTSLESSPIETGASVTRVPAEREAGRRDPTSLGALAK